MELDSKRVLFIGPEFFDYHREIIAEMEGMGLIVDFFPEKIINPYYKVLISLLPFLKRNIDKVFLDSIQKKIQGGYDFVFVIKGEILTPAFLNKVKFKNPNAKFIMYQWDSVKFNANYFQINSMFDRVLTFDMMDAQEFNIEYLPLFFTKKYENIKLDALKEYDILFFGTLHGHRLSVVKKIEKECQRYGLKFKYHLYIKKLLLIRKILTFDIDIRDLKYISTSIVSTETILSFYSKTKSVLDVQLPNQHGLTMRSIEVLGSHLKLITTNSNILHEKMYDESSVYLLDTNEVILDLHFFEEQKNIDMREYRLKNWLLNIFQL